MWKGISKKVILPITVGMSSYMHSPLFRYLDWNQSRMMQIAEVYDIQTDLNSLIMAFSFNKPFPIIPQLPPKTQFIKIKFINQGLDLLNISNIFRDHRVASKIPQYFENLDPPLICYQYKKKH